MFWNLQENVLTDADIEEMVNFIRTTKRFTQSEEVKKFEAAYAQWQGCRHAVFVNSGSSANLILLAAVKELRDWPAQSEVIVPAVTWTTTVTPVMQLGLKPVFVDANLSDLSFDYEKLAQAITPQTRAISLAHLLGFPADLARIREIIGARPIDILEDTCESQGAQIGSDKLGSIGLGGTFSFYWGHHMSTIEGGMVVTNDTELYKLLLLKRSHGLARELPASMHAEIKQQYPDHDFTFLFLTDGFNVRNTELHAFMGQRQLTRMNDYIAIRNRNYDRFLEIIASYPQHLLAVDRPGRSNFCFPFICRSKSLRAQLQSHLQTGGIETRMLISGNLLRQPFLRQFHDAPAMPNADLLHENAFYIGNNQFVDDARLDRLADLLSEVLSLRNDTSSPDWHRAVAETGESAV